MKSIYKFKLNDGTTQLELPVDSQILSVAEQRNDIQMWVLGTFGGPSYTRVFHAFATGEPIKTTENLSFVSTVLLDNGALVLHVFEQTA